ncbi:MAG TPA: four helix bundle protein, partial [Segetibacter sp.]|nr:four helix bundle protein [Segetibacter sp.]
MRNFKELKIWQKGFAIAVSTYKLTGSFPKEERFGITSQITRAAVSIHQTSYRFQTQKQKMLFTFINKL